MVIVCYCYITCWGCAETRGMVTVFVLLDQITKVLKVTNIVGMKASVTFPIP